MVDHTGCSLIYIVKFITYFTLERGVSECNKFQVDLRPADS